MFSGLVKGIGRVASRTNTGADARFVVELGSAAIAPLAVGGSIAVNGVCLTAVAVTPGGFTADASAATLAVTTLGRLAAGARVNLEPPLRAGDPLDGHIVTGHVDGVGEVLCRGGRRDVEAPRRRGSHGAGALHCAKRLGHRRRCEPHRQCRRRRASSRSTSSLTRSP